MKILSTVLICILATLSNANEVTRYTQTLLNNLGYKVGAADGIYGKKTLNGLTRFYADTSKVYDGTISKNEVQDLLKAYSQNDMQPPLRSGIFTENSQKSSIYPPEAPGLTRHRYSFGRRWVTHDWNNDGISDVLYAGVMVPENKNVTGDDTGGWCGGSRCRGQMPGPTLYLGQADGTYRDASHLIVDKRKIPGQSLVGKMLVADFNDDGVLDLFLADNAIGTHKGFRDSYFLSQSDGTWLESSATHLSHSNYVIFDHGGAVGDIDGDGDVDIVLTELKEALTCWINQGEGQLKKRRCGSIHAFGIELGDVDGDGDLDLVHAGHERQGSTDTGVVLNDGRGNFSKRVKLQMIPGWSTVPEVSLWDLDADGDLDITLSRAGVLYVGTGLQIIENLGDLKFQSRFYPLVEAPESFKPKHEGNEWNNFIEEIRFDDVDRDGDTDIYFAGGGGGNNQYKVRAAFLRNDGSMKFTHKNYRARGNPIKIIPESRFKDEPQEKIRVMFEQLTPLIGEAKTTSYSTAFKKYLSGQVPSDYDEQSFHKLKQPVSFAKSGASVTAISEIKINGEKYTYDILVSWAGLNFPVTVCMQYYKQFDFTATRASFREGYGFGGYTNLRRLGTNACVNTDGYAGDWEVGDEAEKIGVKAFLTDLNTNGRRLIANHPTKQKSAVIAILDKLK